VAEIDVQHLPVDSGGPPNRARTPRRSRRRLSVSACAEVDPAGQLALAGVGQPLDPGRRVAQSVLAPGRRDTAMGGAGRVRRGCGVAGT